jgi:hypothetical protein
MTNPRVYIVEAEHHYVPGRVTKAASSEGYANELAADLVETIRSDFPGVKVRPDWRDTLAACAKSWAKREGGFATADDFPAYVSIFDAPLDPAIF